MGACRFCKTANDSKANYCSKCGASLASETKSPDFRKQIADNAVIFLIYLVPLLGPLVALQASPWKQRQDLRFHAWQALALLGVWVGTDIALVVVCLPLGFAAAAALGAIVSIVHLALVLLWIYVLVLAWNSNDIRLPYVSDFADKQSRPRR